MSAIKLDDLRKGAAERYPDFTVEMEDGKILAFQPVFRLDKKARKAVSLALDYQERAKALPEGSDQDQVEFLIAMMQDVFKLTERGRGDFTALKKWAGSDDLAMWMFLFENYNEKTEAGEASPSVN